MKEMLKRALRTFVQAAVGYLATNLVYVVSGNAEDFDALKMGLMGLAISATAAGLAALMNMPKKDKSTDNTDEDEDEDLETYDEEDAR